MDRYQKVEKPRRQPAAINENEVRITTQGLVRNYVSYATSLLQEKNVREIVLKAMGQAISKAVAIAEIIKKRFPGLYQDTTISSVSITDVWEPIEEGLEPLEMTRHVSMISISLSTKELDTNSPGYQSPSYIGPPKYQQRYQQSRQSQHYQQHQSNQSLIQIHEDSYVRSRGRTRGRGRAGGRGRGWGRGYDRYAGYDYNQHGYDNYENGYDYQGGYGEYGHDQDNGGWNSNWGRGSGRNSGWNYRGREYSVRGSGRAGGRGYGRARGRIGSRGRGNQY
ncbi:RNA-binding protein FUS-like [Zingiber officinale]|uniref:RNA-binding protein FUS-like n=1 Tax=Zingiber officinale TaxID=94328 RepID=UPI001C4D8409|nr:RNA-binding protein FUS-like [Zingiber officinale]